MWHEIAFSEGKRRRSFFQVAVSGWEKQRNGYRMGSGGCRERGPPEKSVVPSTRFLERLNCLVNAFLPLAVHTRITSFSNRHNPNTFRTSCAHVLSVSLALPRIQLELIA